VLEIYFHAVLQKMLLKNVAYVLKIKCFISHSRIGMGMGRGRVTYLTFWDPLHASGTAENRDSKFTTVAQSAHYLPQTCLKIPMPLVNSTVNYAFVSAT